MTNSEDPDQTAPIGAVCSGSTLFASMLKLVSNVDNYLQLTTSADVIFLYSYCVNPDIITTSVHERPRALASLNTPQISVRRVLMAA